MPRTSIIAEVEGKLSAVRSSARGAPAAAWLPHLYPADVAVSWVSIDNRPENKVKAHMHLK